MSTAGPGIERRRAAAVALGGMVMYVLVGLLIAPAIQALYYGDPDVFYGPGHFNDARQYALICSQGYGVPYSPLPTLEVSRLNWMPVYAALQCALHHLAGISLVYTGAVISTAAAGLSLFLGVQILANLGVHRAAVYAWAILIPPIGAAWLYLPGAEATYLAVGMAVMWLITLPPSPETPRGQRGELIRALAGFPAGMAFILTKPNALAMLLPLTFAFFYQSWQRSQAVGYAFGLWQFIADVVIDHSPFRFALRRPDPLRPLRYAWAPATIAAGIALGFAGWLAYSSLLSGIPFYFLQQQLNVWGRAWPGGNLGEMLLYFAQAFRDPDGSPWRYNAAWNLAANLAALIPAASPRVPGLLRGMLPLMVIFLLYSGAVHGSDRYMLSTAAVALGWACWVAAGEGSRRTSALRWGWLLVLAVVTSSLLLFQMLPRGEPQAWGIVDLP